MIIIGKAQYRGRWHEAASAMVKAGVRVGMMWISEENEVECHVCKHKFEPPELDPVENDAMGKCPKCEMPFVFASVKKLK